jgi:hypothetical protein
VYLLSSYLGLGGILLIVAFASVLASFVFWCLGNAWILNKYEHVQYDVSNSSDYCYPPLFKGAFGIVIISDVWYPFLVLTIIFACINR